MRPSRRSICREMTCPRPMLRALDRLERAAQAEGAQATAEAREAVVALVALERHAKL